MLFRSTEWQAQSVRWAVGHMGKCGAVLGDKVQDVLHSVSPLIELGAAWSGECGPMTCGGPLTDQCKGGLQWNSGILSEYVVDSGGGSRVSESFGQQLQGLQQFQFGDQSPVCGVRRKAGATVAGGVGLVVTGGIHYGVRVFCEGVDRTGSDDGLSVCYVWVVWVARGFRLGAGPREGFGVSP